MMHPPGSLRRFADGSYSQTVTVAPAGKASWLILPPSSSRGRPRDWVCFRLHFGRIWDGNHCGTWSYIRLPIGFVRAIFEPRGTRGRPLALHCTHDRIDKEPFSVCAIPVPFVQGNPVFWDAEPVLSGIVRR